MSDELTQHRLDKLARIRERGDEPFKYTFARSSSIGEARAAFEKAEATGGESASVDATLAGRMVATRTQGKVTFADLRDESAKIQLFIKKDTVGEAAYAGAE